MIFTAAVTSDLVLILVLWTGLHCCFVDAVVKTNCSPAEVPSLHTDEGKLVGVEAQD
jgi:hypothetical protein